MMKIGKVLLLAAMAAGCATASQAQRPQWQATSKTATSITGDIGLTDTKISLNFASYAIGDIRELSAQELSTVFDWVKPDAEGSGSLFSVEIPATLKAAHGNTLCGAQSVRWLAIYIAPGRKKELSMAMFSGAKPPVFTAEAMNSSTDLCGTYVYQHY